MPQIITIQILDINNGTNGLITLGQKMVLDPNFNEDKFKTHIQLRTL